MYSSAGILTVSAEDYTATVHEHEWATEWKSDETGHWRACKDTTCKEKKDFDEHTPGDEATEDAHQLCTVCKYEIAPALDNGSGKSGWKSIARDIKNASNGDTVYVDMNGTTKLSKIALKELMGKNIDLVLGMNGDITWTINGKTVTKASDVNMTAKLNTNNIPGKVTEKLSENGKDVQVSLSHSGSFGFDAVMTVYLGTMYNGKYANLMYYNPMSGTAEFIDCSLITGGSASLDFTHASEYAIVISDEPMGAYEDVSAAAGAFESGVNVSSAAYVSIITVIAAAMVIFRKRRKSKTDRLVKK